MIPQDQQRLQNGYVVYRSLSPSDKSELKRLHDCLFPIDYHDDFFSRAVKGSGIISFAAVLSPVVGLDQEVNVSETLNETLLGFITACERSSSDISMIHERNGNVLLSDKKSLYILTLGVAEVRCIFCLFVSWCRCKPPLFHGSLMDNMTLQEYRRQGIARTLLKMMENYACQIGCQSIYLHVIKYNTSACQFYANLGYGLVKEIDSFYRITTGRGADPEVQDYDACLYSKMLSIRESMYDDSQQHKVWSLLYRFYLYIYSVILHTSRTSNTHFQGQRGWLKYLFGNGSKRHQSLQQSVRGDDENC